CGHEEPIPTVCRLCGKETQRMRGLGTQQLEHFVGLRFPEARIARMDLDTTSTKWAHHRVLERMAQGKIDILLGTQMIAKGLDFPNVTVVGVVDADTGLHLPDFRAAERTFQLVAQVAGRAGRGPKGGRVYVQTRAPEHHAIRAAAAHSVAEFAVHELPLRAPPNPSYPPWVGLVRFVAAHEDAIAAQEAAERVAAWLAGAPDARFEPAPADGLLPDGFFSTTSLPTYVKAAGPWRRPRLPRMDCVIVLHPTGDLVVTEPRKVRKGQPVAVGTEEDGREGIFVHTEGFLRGAHSANEFGFMQTEVSREKPVDYAVLAQRLGEEKRRSGKILWVVGPALVHARAREDMIWFIRSEERRVGKE